MIKPDSPDIIRLGMPTDMFAIIKCQTWMIQKLCPPRCGYAGPHLSRRDPKDALRWLSVPRCAKGFAGVGIDVLFW